MKSARVLVVDDDPKALAVHADILTGAGFQVHPVRDFPEAARTLRRFRGRMVVLSDLEVRRKPGLGFMRSTLENFPFLPFTFLVSTPSLESAVEALKEGAHDFLVKPVSPEDLRASVERAVRKMEQQAKADRKEKEIRALLLRSREDLKDARTLSSFKGFMISMAAHDFRSIITVLDGYLQLLREKCRGCSLTAPEGVMHQASRTIARLQTMAHTLFDYEAAESGRIRLEIRSIPLREILGDSVAFYKPYAEQKGIDLSLGKRIPDAELAGDRGKVMEVLDNLLYNALRFTPSGGTIRLSGKSGHGCAIISVADSGPGISKERLNDLFQKEKIVATLDSHARLGLGLTICKILVEAQGGRIWIDSKVGKGTKVNFTIPIP